MCRRSSFKLEQLLETESDQLIHICCIPALYIFFQGLGSLKNEFASRLYIRNMVIMFQRQDPDACA